MIRFVHPFFGLAETVAPPSFAPTDLGADLQAWYDIQDIASMYQTTDTSTPAVVNSPVGRVNDKSGNARHLTQSDSGKRPVLRQSGSVYYLEFDGSDDNLTTTINFGSANKLAVLAGFTNRAQTDLAGYLEMTSSSSPGPATMRVRQRASGPLTVWDALLSATSGEGSGCNATANTTAPNSMVMVSQHDVAGDLSTIRVNGVAGSNGAGDKGTNALGSMDVNVGKINFRSAMSLDLYCLIISTALITDPTGAEYYIDDQMGGGVMPPYEVPGPPLARPDVGFARELGGRFPWMAFAQPTAQFSFWQDVGVNVLDSWNPDVSGASGYDYNDMASFNSTHIAAAEAWDSAAISAGFKIARHPFTASRATADLSNADVIGWPVYDEPEAGDGFDIGPQLAMLDEADPDFTKVRAMNNSGPAVIYQQAASLFPYFDQFGSYPAVQGGFDLYPVQQTTAGKTVILSYRPNGQPYTATHTSTGLESARTEEWLLDAVPTPNMLAHSPYAVFIATGGFVETYQTTLRIPTPEQVRFQIADAIVMGAEGISFFPQRFEWLDNGYGTYYKTFTSHNATPSDVKTQLTTTIANWQALETEFATNLLIDPATNRIWPTEYRVCPDTSPSGQQTTAESGWTFVSPPTAEYLPGPFQGSVRTVDGVGLVYFIQNLANATASLTDTEWGFSGVSFAAWETLVFIEGDLVNAVWSDIDGVLP